MNEIYENGAISDCCNALIKFSDICSDCGEHCSPVYDDEEEE